MGTAVLTGRGRRRFEAGHPWIYADDLARVEAEPGDLVELRSPRGERAGWGLFSDASRIAVRTVARGGEAPDEAAWRAAAAACVERRARLGRLDPTGAARLVHGDADGFPGWVVDHYAGALVLQSGIQASDRLRDVWLAALLAALPWEPETIVDRSDASVRRLERLEPRVEVLRGAAAPVLVREPGLAYEVDLLGGHKTGHYLDQRDNRIAAAACAAGRDVLDAFCYDGLFGIRAALCGARSVVCLDQSREALERCGRTAERNGVAPLVRTVRANAMRELRDLERGALGEDLPRAFGLVVVDPPAFARNRRELEGAERGYRELNRRALALVEPGGLLVTASCSYALSAARFEGLLAEAAHLSGRRVVLEALTGAAPDHPVLLVLPESAYLKCAYLRVD